MFPVTTLTAIAPKRFYELQSVGTGNALLFESFWTLSLRLLLAYKYQLCPKEYSIFYLELWKLSPSHQHRAMGVFSLGYRVPKSSPGSPGWCRMAFPQTATRTPLHPHSLSFPYVHSFFESMNIYGTLTVNQALSSGLTLNPPSTLSVIMISLFSLDR